MEPTIYKPSIYKGAGIYKIGAEGGGGIIPSGTHFNENIGGKIYDCVKLPNGQIWTCNNLDFVFNGLTIDGAATQSTNNAYYYDRDENVNGWNGNKVGLLYNRPARDYIISNENILFNGWRVATTSDWDSLISLLDVGNDGPGLLLRREEPLNTSFYKGLNFYKFNLYGAYLDTNNNSFSYWASAYWDKQSSSSYVRFQNKKAQYEKMNDGSSLACNIRLVKDE